MKPLLVCILCAFPLLAQETNPSWVKTPVPHWSCPKGYFIPGDLLAEESSPIACEKVTPAFLAHHGYDPEQYEEIPWKWTKTVPPSGVVRIDYPDGFARMPGCMISEKTDPKAFVGVSEPTIKGFSMKATPGHVLELKCKGLIAR